MSVPLLSCTHLAKYYDERLIFSDVSLTLMAGSVTILAGPNGCGKSTLLKILAGLAKPAHGDIECTLSAMQVGYLGHATFLYPQMTVVENLHFWGCIHNLRSRELEKRTDDLLSATCLETKRDERVAVLSRGMAQRLALARVLLNRPRLLLLDEPGAGLDDSSLAFLHATIRTCREEGGAVLWVSHTLDQDAPCADHIAHFENRTLKESA